MEILKGIGYCLLVISLYKIIHYKYFRDSVLAFSRIYWIRKNFIDYIMLVGVSFVTVQYSHEIIDVLNIVLTKLTIDWQVPHFEDNSFYWVLVPVVFPLVMGKFAKKKGLGNVVSSIGGGGPKRPKGGDQ